MGILREKFADLNLVYSIGGQISFDVFPQVRFRCKAWRSQRVRSFQLMLRLMPSPDLLPKGFRNMTDVQQKCA